MAETKIDKKIVKKNIDKKEKTSSKKVKANAGVSFAVRKSETNVAQGQISIDEFKMKSAKKELKIDEKNKAEKILKEKKQQKRIQQKTAEHAKAANVATVKPLIKTEVSEAVANFEKYEQEEQEKKNFLYYFNFKKYFQKLKESKGQKIKKTKEEKAREREERNRNKIPKLKKIPPLENAVRYNIDPAKGLSEEQVHQRMVDGYYNVVTTKTTKSYWQIFLGNIFTFFNILCFVVAGALIWVKSFANLTFVLLFVANMAIAIIQEIKAKRTVEKISLLTAPVAVVVRNGKKEEIAVDKICLDDIVLYQLGKQVCADSIIISGEVEVNESLLTGESNPIKKKVGDLLYAGSFISSGKCTARVDRIGEYNYSSSLVTKAQEFKKRKSELLSSIQLIIKVIGVIIIPLAILMFFNNKAYFLGEFPGTNPISQTIVKTAGAILSMIPAGMYLLCTMALAVGVIKLARKRTLVQDLYSIEMLSRTDVICLDKTGTITDGTMKVNTVIQVTNTFSTLHDIIGSMLTALDDNNQTSLALAQHFGYSKELNAIATLPFSSQRKLSAVTFKDGKTDRTFILGAPEFVLKTKDADIEKTVKQYAQKGFRVLVLAQATGKIDKDKLPANATSVAVIVVEDRIRENAAETLNWFKENGVEIKIISGDNAITVSEVSKRVGVTNAEKFISLEGMTKQQVVESANKYTVFGRVSPEQKSILVKALKAEGHKVAMTGDGVNDILALKEADCSIAMASGSEAARNVSQVVLLDSNFSSMPSIVGEGRRVINNISKSSSLFLMKTIFAVLINIICLISRETFPFEPIQLFLLEFFVIGVPSFVLALQPNTDQIKGNFLFNLISKALPGAILFTLGVVACMLFNKIVGTGGQFETMAALVLTFTGLSILFRICRPFDIIRTFLFLFSTTCIILALTLIPLAELRFVNLEVQNTLFVIVIVLLAYLFYDTIMRGTDFIMNKLRRHKNVEKPDFKQKIK